MILHLRPIRFYISECEVALAMILMPNFATSASNQACRQTEGSFGWFLATLVNERVGGSCGEVVNHDAAHRLCEKLWLCEI